MTAPGVGAHPNGAFPDDLRVALVHDWLTGMRGGEKVLEAIAELFPNAPIFTLVHIPGSVSAALERRTIHTSFIQRLPGVRRGYRRYLPLFPSAIEDFDLTAFDLVVSSSHCVAKGVIPGPGAFHVCYCHSPMRYAWDQEQIYFPRRRGLAARARNLALTALRAWDVSSAARVDLFLANSRFVAERIRRYYRRDAEVLAPPVAVEDFALDAEDGRIAYHASPSTRPERCLMVAAMAPYKRVDIAMAACERLGIGLDVVGDGPERNRLERRADPNCRLLGRVEGEHLERLYREATCFVQPGIEDFGIAAVEALASGTPVVAVGRGGVLDIVDDGVHGVLYDDPAPVEPTAGTPSSIERLTAAIDKCRQIRFNSLELQSRAQTFSRATFLEQFRRHLIPRISERRAPYDDPQASP